MIAWKLENRLLDAAKHRSYGVHYTDPHTSLPHEHHVDFCLTVEDEVDDNSYGFINMMLLANQCAHARDVGSRSNNRAVLYLYEDWLPKSGEELGDFPAFFHYVNVGPNVAEGEMITDVYLPLR